MSFPLSPADLAAAFDGATLAAARRLVAGGGVKGVEVRRGGAVVTARVEEEGNAYRVFVRIGATPAGLAGECGCGRERCRHAAAALLHLAEGGATPAAAAAPAAPPPAEPLPDADHRLLYLLHPAAAGGLTVAPVIARLRPDGGFAELHDFSPADALRAAARGTPPRFLLPVDLELLAALVASAPPPPAALPLAGPGAPALLARLAATGHCHLRRPGRPLLPGAARPAVPHWRCDEGGVQHLQWDLSPPPSAVVFLPLPWYLDEREGRCGPLHCAVPEAVWPWLLPRLPLAPADSASLRRELEARFPALPLPRPWRLEVLPPVAPGPLLRLTAAGHAELLFRYHGHLFSAVGAEGPARRLAGERVVETARDHPFEQACRARLGRLGLRRAEAGGWLPMAGDEGWRRLQLDALPLLRSEGWEVEVAAGFRHRPAEVTGWLTETSAADGDWLEVTPGLLVEGERVDLLPALLGLLGQSSAEEAAALLAERAAAQEVALPLPDGRWVALPGARLRPILELLAELHAEPGEPGRLRLRRWQLARLAEGDAEWDQGERHWLGDREACELARSLCRHPAAAATAPRGLALPLRDYQREGLGWLQWLAAHRLGGVLADDMGLGKTIQTLAHLLAEREAGRADLPSLAVLPTSLLPGWRDQAAQAAPALRLLTLHGPHRREQFAAIPAHDLVLTTYPLLQRDADLLAAQPWHLLVLDEAQAIKNPAAAVAAAARLLDARHRLCLTGTPLENHLGELWSLFHFLLPGLLGEAAQFQRLFRRPVEEQGDADAAARLARRIAPFLLRRTKEAVAAELPPKSEMTHAVELEGAQRELYESIRLALHERVRQEVAEKGWGRSRIVLLDALLKLRQVCCDPRLVKLEQARRVTGSAKLELLLELLPELIEEGRRVLLFSQFTGMLDLIRAAVSAAAIPFVELTGRSRDRAEPVARFQRGEVPLFLISLKAGGSGLNLTAADTVIHYDPWWNPAVERQASDRAHRLGQQRPVFVYKLICRGTVEEKMQALQARKQALADTLFHHAQGGMAGWGEADLEQLFEPLE